MARIEREKIKRILVVTLNNIGDVILTTSVISLLREHFPSSHLAVLVGPKAVDVLNKSETVDQIFIYNKQTSWFEKLKLVFRLRKEKFDLVIDLKNTAIPFLIGARYRTPIGLDRSFPRMRDQHISRLKFLMPVTFREENRFNFFSKEVEKSALEKLRQNLKTETDRDFVMLAPGARMALKRWNLSGFAQVASHFLKNGKAVVLVGGREEAELGKDLARSIDAPVVNLIDALTLREFSALIRHASLIVANDSAPMHLAFELGRPVVGLFGPTNEIKCGREGAKFRAVRLADLDCAPCELTRCFRDHRICLDDLSASSVICACEELLNGSAH